MRAAELPETGKGDRVLWLTTNKQFFCISLWKWWSSDVHFFNKISVLRLRLSQWRERKGTSAYTVHKRWMSSVHPPSHGLSGHNKRELVSWVPRAKTGIWNFVSTGSTSQIPPPKHIPHRCDKWQADGASASGVQMTGLSSLRGRALFNSALCLRFLWTSQSC